MAEVGVDDGVPWHARDAGATNGRVERRGERVMVPGPVLA